MSSKRGADPDWKTPGKASKDKRPKTNAKKQKFRDEEYCKVCSDGGDLLCCDSCPSVYHRTCLSPPLKSIPKGDWICPRCIPLPGKAEKILSWRWALDRSVELRTSKGEKRREYFIKWHGMSYWHCEWIPEGQMLLHHASMVASFQRRSDMEEPSLEELDDQDGNLHERFYRYGIKPEWLLVQRVINHSEEPNGGTMYLVKWRELSYNDSSWERKRQHPGSKPGYRSLQETTVQ